MCQVKNWYISEITIPIVPNAPNILFVFLFLNNPHTPIINNSTDIIPIGLSKLINPLISCTPFFPPYWFNNIGNKLTKNAIVNLIFFFINSSPSNYCFLISYYFLLSTSFFLPAYIVKTIVVKLINIEISTISL